MKRGSAFLLILLGGCSARTHDLVPKRLCEASADVASPGTYNTSDIASSASLVMNGDAAVVDGALRLIPAAKNAVGSAFFAQPLAFDRATSLYAHFAFRMGGGDGELGGDGLAFVLHSNEAGVNTLGADGDGLGYKGITPSIVVEFDTGQNGFDPATDHTALTAFGDQTNHLALAPTPSLNDGRTRFVWIDYDSSTRELQVFVSSSPERAVSPSFSYSELDVSSALGAEVYLGFSASSGEAANDHDLLGAAWFSPSPGGASPPSSVSLTDCSD